MTEAPKHLSEESKTLWDWAVLNFELSEAELAILRSACVMLDEAEKARKTLEAQGRFYQGNGGVRRAHPAVGALHDALTAAVGFLAKLGLNATPERVRNPNWYLAHRRADAQRRSR